MKFSFYNIPIPFSLGILRRFADTGPVIVNYHVVSDNCLPYIENLYNYRSVNVFTEEIDFFIRNYNVIGLHDLLISLKHHTKLPDNSLLITFDDGFREVHDIVLPILLKKKISATFFLTTGFLDNKELGYMNKKSLLISRLSESSIRSDLKKIISFLNNHELDVTTVERTIKGISYEKRYLLDELATILNIDFNNLLNQYKPYLTRFQVHELIKEGMTVGSHSIDHPKFSELSTEDQILQAVESTNYIRNNFGIDYGVFAFPYTDIGITKKFFQETAEVIDASFGTQGMFKDCISNNLQRVNIEKFDQHALKSLKSYYARHFVFKVMGRDKIQRE